ncbi:MAG: thioredoxin-dependent thiol peroxidase [Bacteroidales bacterium]|jgi:peroxiredoxin Q/BCP|nr:thioredoxin-dependent thiol peroxidase [Bacteroidales bacterium]
MSVLNIGDNAPDFVIKEENGAEIKLSDLKNNKIILYFYPKDNTPGCTAEACNLRDNFDVLSENGFRIIGVSPDSLTSHDKFRTKHNLNFDLVSDGDKEIMNAYGVWGLKKMYGKEYEGVIRTTYIINESGKIDNVIAKVKTKDHAKQILDLYGIE